MRRRPLISTDLNRSPSISITLQTRGVGSQEDQVLRHPDAPQRADRGHVLESPRDDRHGEVGVRRHVAVHAIECLEEPRNQGPHEVELWPPARVELLAGVQVAGHFELCLVHPVDREVHHALRAEPTAEALPSQALEARVQAPVGDHAAEVISASSGPVSLVRHGGGVAAQFRELGLGRGSPEIATDLLRYPAALPGAQCSP